MKRIAIKIGSNVLSRADGKLDITQMSALVEQMAELYHEAGPNNSRAYTNIKAVYDDIRNDFYYRLNN